MAIIDHVRPASADRGRGRVIITSQEMKAERISVYSTRLIYSKVSNEISNKLILTSLHSKRFRRLFRTFEAFFAFWQCDNWGEGEKWKQNGIFISNDALKSSQHCYLLNTGIFYPIIAFEIADYKLFCENL